MVKLYKTPIKAAKEPADSATTWYRITINQLLDNPNWKDNVWVEYLLEAYDLDDLFRLDSMEGSFVEDHELYLLKSDYNEIVVDGETVLPDEAPDRFDLDALDPYIEDADMNIVRSLTELDLDLSMVDVESVAREELLHDYSLARVATDAEDIGLIEIG